MHLKFKMEIDVLTHKVCRDLLISEFYTLHELHLIIEASLGWNNCNYYGFYSEDLSWEHCNLLEGDHLMSGQFMAEGTKISEILPFWKDEPFIYRCGNRMQWEFTIKLVDSFECHPDIMTAALHDGIGDMPLRSTDLGREFLADNEKNSEDGVSVLRRFTSAKCQPETSIGKCSEQVSALSAKISRARRLKNF